MLRQLEQTLCRPSTTIRPDKTRPTLAAVTAAIDDLQAAEAAALTRAKGAATKRNEKRTALLGVLRHLSVLRQVYAQATATPTLLSPQREPMLS